MSEAAGSAAPSGGINRDAVLAAAGPEIEAMRAEGKALIARFKRLIALGLAFPILGGALAALVLGPSLAGLGFFLGLVGMVVHWIVIGLGALSRVSDARARVMEAAAPALGMTFSARPAEPIDLSAFDGTYYGSALKHSRVEDVLSGTRRGAQVELFDVKLRARSKGPDGEWRSSEPPPWLKGVVFAQHHVVRISMPGRWTARTIVQRDSGIANRLNKPAGLDSVRLVDPEFERIFEVYSSDQVEARALFTPDFMERLKALEDFFHPEPGKGDENDGPPPAVGVFQDGRFLLAMPFAEASRHRAKARDRLMKGEFTLEQILDELDAIMGVVDALAGAEAS